MSSFVVLRRRVQLELEPAGYSNIKGARRDLKVIRTNVEQMSSLAVIPQ